jgi:hypothetical protein
VNQADKSLRRAAAFDIFKLLVARASTDWDFGPIAAKSCDAVEAFYAVVLERYPHDMAVGEIKQPQIIPAVTQPPRGPAIGMPGPSGI